MVHAIFAEISETSKVSIRLADDLPARTLDHVTSTPHPCGVTMPKPVSNDAAKHPADQ